MISLDYDTMQSGKRLPTFYRNLLHPASGQKIFSFPKTQLVMQIKQENS
jgi:hypothetical protein